MKKNVLLAIFIALSPLSTYAQDTHVGTESKKTTSISQQKDGKFSLNDSENDAIIEDAEAISPTDSAFYYIIKDGKHGIYFMNGEPCIPIEFDNIERVYGEYWRVTKDKKIGLRKPNGKKLLSTSYEDIRAIIGEKVYFIVKKNKYGLCNENGKTLVPTQYTKIRRHNGFWTLEKGTSSDYLLNDQYLMKGVTISDYEIPFLHKEDDESKLYYSFKKGNLWGITDEDGRIHIKAQYTKRLQVVNYKDENSPIRFVAYANNRFGIIDLDNKMILPIQYNYVVTVEHKFQNIQEIESKQGKQLFGLNSDRIVTPFYYDNCKADSSYLYLSKGAFVTPFDPRKEQVVLPFEYNNTQNIEGSDNFIAQKENKYGIVNSKNEVLVPFVYDNIKNTAKPNMLIIQQGGKYGIIDNSNKLLYGMIDNAIESYSDHLEIQDFSKPVNPRLDYELNEIKVEYKTPTLPKSKKRHSKKRYKKRKA